MAKRKSLGTYPSRSLDELLDELEPVAGDPAAPTLMISFAGARLGMGVSRLAFRKCIEGVPVKVLMTPDTYPWWWADKGILADAAAGAAARAKLQARWPHERLICEGTSLGATTALMAGTLFGADLVLAFAALTFIGKWRRLYYRDKRWPGGVVLRKSPAMRRIRCDLKYGLRQPAFAQALLIADRNDRLDALHARRLLRPPRIKVRWEETGGHSVLRAMYLHGTLAPFLADAVAGRLAGEFPPAAAKAPEAEDCAEPAGKVGSG